LAHPPGEGEDSVTATPFTVTIDLEILLEQLPQVMPVVLRTATESALAPILMRKARTTER
jgi:hypothetical protein